MDINYKTKSFFLLLISIVIFTSHTLAKPPIIVTNPYYRLVINSDKGTIESFRNTISGGENNLLISDQG